MPTVNPAPYDVLWFRAPAEMPARLPDSNESDIYLVIFDKPGEGHPAAPSVMIAYMFYLYDPQGEANVVPEWYSPTKAEVMFVLRDY